MEITSTKKAVGVGLIYGTVVFFVYFLFCCAVLYLLDGEFFSGKGGTRDVVNGISLVAVETAGIIISMSIPVFLLRYKSIDLYMISIFVAVLLYVICFMGNIIILGSIPVELAKKNPLNSFDALLFGMVIFPLGSIIGMVVNTVVNFLINRKERKR